MIKAFLRFFMLLMLCSMIVYAPEILSAVSAPYSLTTSSRSLLRIALYGSTENTSTMHTLINAYQKQYPGVHLRVTHISPEQIAGMQPPYPDVILCCDIPTAPLPSVFSLAGQRESLVADQTVLCAVSQQNTANGAAEQFAAYINEAVILQQQPFQK